MSALRPGNRRTCQHGTALIEFMIVAPFLFMLIFASAELGRLIQHHETLIKTVRNAARYAASETAGSLGVVVLTSDIINSTRKLAVHGNIGGTGGSVLPGFSTTDVTVTDPVVQHIQVTANYTYQPIFGLSIPTFGLGSGAITLSLPMTATTIMRSL